MFCGMDSVDNSRFYFHISLLLHQCQRIETALFFVRRVARFRWPKNSRTLAALATGRIL